MLNTNLNYKNGLNWIKDSFLLFKKNPGTSIIMTAGFLLALISLSVLSSFIPIIGGVILQALFMCLSAGLLLYTHNLSHSTDNSKLHHIKNFFFVFNDINLIGKTILASVFYFCILIVSLILAMAIDYLVFIKDFTDLANIYIKNNNKLSYIEPSLVIKLFIIPIIFLITASVSGVFAPYLIIFKKTPILKAFYLSLRASISNFGAFFCYAIIIFLMLIISGMTFGLGLIVSIPILFLSLYYMFCDLFNGLDSTSE